MRSFERFHKKKFKKKDIQKYKQNIQIRDKKKLGFLSDKSHQKILDLKGRFVLFRHPVLDL